jgi:hypothetical protein
MIKHVENILLNDEENYARRKERRAAKKSIGKIVGLENPLFLR